ncbi:MULTISPECIES: ammonium transporter [unclassified Nitratiruptor]|uniref:ammonium transporter n=1 Tax=unclassified Nitratiruptor TaxID=2624044 RepID=UPI0019152D53|nr:MULTISPECIES: ammonium transporter [unclassified Nitratiruptor]BCD60736.1 ammonium transporter, Amt family [Nitratiruptor sp. YY08-10]BCD64668.1 ammonium transporter, Amt family [Nitratiruptor sp. YY08-14]
MKIVLADNVFIFVATAFVLLMSIPALALFYGGLTRVKSMLNTMMMVMVAFCLVSFLWIAFGYSLTFGDGAVIGDLKHIFLSGIKFDEPAPAAPNLYHYLFIFFQMTFAAITVALMAGAFVERLKFSAWILISVLWATFVYFPVAHWIWGGGWLSDLHVVDFAGGIVVHETSGLAALLGAIMLGRRKEPIMLPSSLPLVAIGTGLLWFGWFGFNGGSALGMNAQAISAAFNSTIAAFIAGFLWMGFEWIKYKKATSLGLFTGIIAGLATITPASGYVDIGGSILIGILGAIVCFWAVVYAKKRFKYDDSLDVFGVHGVGGIVGALMIGILAVPEIGGVKGLIYGGGFSQLGYQIVGLLVVGVYTLLVTFVVFKVVGMITGLRVSKEEEIMGLDEYIHGEKAYIKEY